jgi:chromosomal replication initiator protein
MENQNNPELEKIFVDVCTHLNVDTTLARSKSRKMELVSARQIYCKLAKEHASKVSLSSIGRVIGKRDHATVLHGIKQVDDLCFSSKVFRKKYEETEEKLFGTEVYELIDLRSIINDITI